MTLGEFFHVGILVPDLEDAIRHHERVEGHPFNDPTSLHLDMRLANGRSESVEVRVSYSRVGPPYIELVEASGEGVFGRRHPPGVHHLGFWVPVGIEAGRVLTDAGLDVEATVVGPTGSSFAYFTEPQSMGGVRLELIDASRRASLEAWFAGGPHPGHD